ncbi:MAG: glycosyltransferase family A protein [Bacteroidota bacterium]
MAALKLVCVIPFFNEERFIAKTLDSLLAQTRLPDKIVLVNDGSSDSSPNIVRDYESRYDGLIIIVNNEKSNSHLPGGKVVRAFKAGLDRLNHEFDVICKFDADLIFPEDYLELIVRKFESSHDLGIVGGICTVEKDGLWIPETVSDKDHVRGALKAYKKSCFEAIGGLREGMGWDTLDELLAVYRDFKVICLSELKVKHLKPTGAKYSQSSKYFKGMAFYRMGYGFLLTFIASAKLAKNEKSISRFLHHLIGHFKGVFGNMHKMVSRDEEKFIRAYRWRRIKRKLF